MNKRLLLLASACEASIILGAVYFEPSYLVRAALWRDAFFEGKPTSWWRAELERFEIRQSDKWVTYHRHDSMFEKARERWYPTPRDVKYGRILETLLLEIDGPTIIRHDPEAAPVLRQLLDDRSPKIRRFARIGLKMEPFTER